MTDYFDFFNQRIGKMMQRQAETFAAVTAAPCKNFSSTPLDSATIDGSDYDTQTSTNVQGGVVPANLYSCNHWILDQHHSRLRLTGRMDGDLRLRLKQEISMRISFGKYLTHDVTVLPLRKPICAQILIFNKQPDGSFTRNNSTSKLLSACPFRNFGFLLSRSHFERWNTAIKNVGDPYAIRINTSQLNTMINANINAISTWVGTFPVAKYYDDCFMLSTQPPSMDSCS